MDNSAALTTLASAPARTPGVARYAYAACERLLRPVARLALWYGLKFHDLDELLRKLLLEEAALQLKKSDGKAANASQLSVSTGINRKEIKRLSEEGSQDLPSSERSIAAVVFASWLREAGHDALSKPIPVMARSKGVSFEALVNETGRDVHYRSVLDELLRLGLVLEADGWAKLTTPSYMPERKSDEQLSTAADNLYAHMSATVSNVCAFDQPFLEQVVWANGFAREDCLATQEEARAVWLDARAHLLSTLEKNNPSTTPLVPHRVRIGMYVHFEPQT